MGITGFAKFVKETWPEAICETTLQEYKFEGRIAVDGNNEAYVYMHTSKNIVINGLGANEVMECVVNQEARKNLYNRIRIMWVQKIVEFIFTDLRGKAVWVVDGKNTPVLKSEVRETRKEKVESSRKNFKEYVESLSQGDDFIDPHLARTKLLEYMCSTPPKKSDYDLITYVLYRTGIPVIRAWGEGEKTCSRLCLRDVPENLRCGAVWSADVDSILFGAPILIQRLRRSKTEPDVRSTIRIIDRSKMSIGDDDLIGICIAAGCDYYKRGISRLGLKSAYKLILKGEPIPTIPETENLGDLFKHDSGEVYEVMKPTPPQEPDMIKKKARWLIDIYQV